MPLVQLVRASVAAAGRVFIWATNLHKHDPDTHDPLTNPAWRPPAGIYLFSNSMYVGRPLFQPEELWRIYLFAHCWKCILEKRKRNNHKVAKNLIWQKPKLRDYLTQQFSPLQSINRLCGKLIGPPTASWM